MELDYGLEIKKVVELRSIAITGTVIHSTTSTSNLKSLQ